MNLIQQFEKESGMKYPKHDMSAQANFDELYEEWLENRVPQWIDIKERLPDSIGYYLIFYTEYWNHNQPKRIGFAFFNSDSRFAMENGFYEPTHWMPLPEKPKNI